MPEPRHVDAHGKPHTYVVPGAPGYRDILVAADLAPALADPSIALLDADGPAAQLLTQLAATAGGCRDAGTPSPMLLLRVERGEDEDDA